MAASETARTVWVVRAGRTTPEENREQFALERDLAVITYGQESDLRAHRGGDAKDTERKIAEAMRRKWKCEVNWRHPRQCRLFAFEIEIGDLVILPLRFARPGKIAVGKILGDYDYRPENSAMAKHCRPVEWLSTGFPRSSLRDNAEDPVVKSLLNLANLQGTVAEVNRKKAAPRKAAEKLLSLLAKERRPAALR